MGVLRATTATLWTMMAVLCMTVAFGAGRFTSGVTRVGWVLLGSVVVLYAVTVTVTAAVAAFLAVRARFTRTPDLPPYELEQGGLLVQRVPGPGTCRLDRVVRVCRDSNVLAGRTVTARAGLVDVSGGTVWFTPDELRSEPMLEAMRRHVLPRYESGRVEGLSWETLVAGPAGDADRALGSSEGDWRDWQAELA